MVIFFRPHAMLLCTRLCGVMGGFARGTVAIVNLSDREHSFHLNEMELPVQMAGSEASTTSTSIDLEQPKVSHEALHGPPSFARRAFTLSFWQNLFSHLSNHLLHALRAAPFTSRGLHLLSVRLLTVSINRCFDKFLILAKRGILFGATKEVIKQQEK